MTWEDKIKAGVISIVRTYLASSKLRAPKMCTVVSVSGDAADGLMICDCKPIDGTAVIEDVKLTADYPEDDNKAGFVLVPKEGSLVQVSFNSASDAYVSMVSRIEKIFLNGNDYGGIPQVQPLVDKINALENNYNSVLNTLKGIVVTIPSGGGAVSFATFFAAINDITPITKKADLENTTVEHGSGNLS